MGACIQSVSKSRVLSLGVLNSQPNIWKFWTDLTSILSDAAKRKRVREFLKQNKTGHQVRGPRPHLLRMGVILVPRGIVDVGKFSTKTHGFWCRLETDSNLPAKGRRRFQNFSKSAFPLFSVISTIVHHFLLGIM